jgi:hypothetical protein
MLLAMNHLAHFSDMGEVIHGEEHGATLLLDGVERFIVANVNLGVEVIGGDSGYGRSCVGGSGR